MARKVKKPTKVTWRRKPAAHDYPAADSYLSLLVADPALRAELVAQLQAAPIIDYKAKDLLRASQLPLLTKDNEHVAIDLKKIGKKVSLSPVLLVRGDLVRGFPLQVADGYHRVCASHLVDEDTDIPCRLIDLPLALPGRPRVPRTQVQAAVPVAEVAAAPVETAPVETAPVESAPIELPVAKKPAVKKASAKKAPVVKKIAAVKSASPRRTRKVSAPVEPKA